MSECGESQCCPKCGGGIIAFFHLAFCRECDWYVGKELHEDDRKMLKKMLIAAFEDDEEDGEDGEISWYEP